jgi:simple sugar transport system substrate-binding protein
VNTIIAARQSAGEIRHTRANKIAGETTPATYDFKAAAIPQALLTAQPGAVNVATLGKIIPGWGQTEDFIAPWFATLEAKNK